MATNTTTPSYKRLNVIFHGTFFFWVKLREKEVEVLIPKVEMHAYYAGNWQQGELEWMKEDKYDLQNVLDAPDLQPYPQEDNIVVKIDPELKGHGNLRRINLHRPEKIWTLQRLDLEKNISVPKALENFKEISAPRQYLGLIHVLTYKVENGKVPQVAGLSWAPVPSKVPGCGDVANLHIFADPPSRLHMGSMTEKHPQQAFKALMDLMPQDKIPGLSRLKFSYSPNEIPLIEPDKEIPHGLRRIELVSLATSNLLSERQAHGHGIMRNGSMSMPMAAKSGAGHSMHMSMDQNDIGNNPPNNCTSTGGGNGH